MAGDPVDMPRSARYTTDRLSIPGMKFRVDIDDPKMRIQAYIDEYKIIHHSGQAFEVRESFHEDGVQY
jgi:hypothetical protein